ncbi:MAG TPA: sporulation protein YqfC [Desulfotomaculum sp.]|nr:sporulation protein YqfC [Desulfotomaculum sp.]
MRWREVREQVKRKAALALELPGEVALDLPKIIITGNIQVLIENHRGIVAYSPELVKILVETGEVAVSGENLSLKSIVQDEIIIEGDIHAVTFM